MGEIGGFDDFILVDDHADFDLTGADHLDIDATFAQEIEKRGCDTGVTSHSDADDAKFGDAIDGGKTFRTDFLDERTQGGLDLWEFVSMHSERDVGGVGCGDVLHDHIHVDAGLGDGIENAGGDTGMVGHVAEGDFCLVSIDADAANDDIFHAHSFFFDEGAWVLVKAAANFKKDAEFFGKFDRARLHHFGARGGHFEHFVVAYFLKFACGGNDARVGGINAIDVGKNLAEISFGGSGKGDGGEIGAAASEGGDAVVCGLALEPGDDANIARVEVAMELSGGDVGDFGLGMHPIGGDAGLGAGEGYGFAAEGIDGHGGEGDGGLFARGEEHVHLAFGGRRGDFAGEANEIIGDARHGGDDDHDLVTFALGGEDALGDIANAFGAADGGAAEFLDDETHREVECGVKISFFQWDFFPAEGETFRSQPAIRSIPKTNG